MKIKKITPLLNHIVTTADVYPEDVLNDGISDSDNKYAGEFKEYQTVVAVGPNVNTIKAGQVVRLNPRNYVVPVHKEKADSITGLMTDDEVVPMVKFPIMTINGIPHLFLYDRDCDFIIDEFDDDSEVKNPEPNIIEL